MNGNYCILLIKWHVCNIHYVWVLIQLSVCVGCKKQLALHLTAAAR